MQAPARKTVAFGGAGLPAAEWREERMERVAGRVIFFFFHGEEGLVMKGRGEGGEARLMEITFHSIWRKGERERKEDEPEMRLNFNEGKFPAK